VTLSGPLQALLQEDGSHPEKYFAKSKIESVSWIITNQAVF